MTEMYESRATPGVQAPEKYRGMPVGPNYLKWGEQPGWIYDPYSDKYRKPRNEQELVQAGLADAPKTPGLGEALLPLAGSALALEGGKALGQQIMTPGGLKGLLNIGGGTTSGTLATESTKLAVPKIVGATRIAGEVETPVSSGLGSSFLSGVAVPAAVAGAVYLGGKSALNLIKGKEDKSTQGKIGRGLLGIATGGISEIARPFLVKPSTRDIAKKNTAGLLALNKNDAQYQNYVKSMREQYNSAPVDPSKPFAGKYGSFEEYKQAGLEASDLTGVLGNIKTFGKEWTSLSEDQRQKVTQGLIDANLYDSKKGEVIVTDAKKAQEIKNQILGITPLKPDTKTIPKGLLGVK